MSSARRRSGPRAFVAWPCVALGAALAMVGSTPAMADGPAATPPVRHTARNAKMRAPIPAANATLHVTPGALGTPWTFEITNTDDTPLRIVADSRLLSLDLTPGDDGDDDAPPKKHGRPVHCALPSEVRPSTDSDRVQFLPPDITYVVEFDPRMYCFDAHDAAALTPDAKLVAHLGWSPSSSRAGTPPFVADETLNGQERVGMKQLVSQTVTVPDTISSEPPPMHRHALVVRAPTRIDAESGRTLIINVSVENTTTRPVHLMLRPETLAFEVSSPRGVYWCSGKTHQASAIAEVFRTIPPHGKASTSVLLASICPDATFKSAGVYTVEARIDTRHASGRSIGIETFDGVVHAEDETLVRVRRDRARRP